MEELTEPKLYSGRITYCCVRCRTFVERGTFEKYTTGTIESLLTLERVPEKITHFCASKVVGICNLIGAEVVEVN